jgi:hypothetical protein
LDTRILSDNLVAKNLCLGLINMLSSEEELPVEITDINSVQVNLKFESEELTTVTRLKPVTERVFMTSQPIPPAPTTSTLQAKIFLAVSLP